MSKILTGKPVADKISNELITQVEILHKKGVDPTLGIIRVGERADDIAYERGVSKRAEKIGIRVNSYVLPIDAEQSELLNVINKVNKDEKVHGVLLFRPLPEQFCEEEIAAALDSEKDIDGVTPLSMAGLYSGQENVFSPCTAESCMEILKYYDIDIEGKTAVVIGRSLVIGKPVSLLLQKYNATVTMCHSKTRKLSEITKRADIIIVASGKQNTLTKENTRSGQTIIDVGINVDADGNLCGDADFDGIEPLDVFITPVPGGVGSVTSSVLCRHVVIVAEKRLCKPK